MDRDFGIFVLMSIFVGVFITCAVMFKRAYDAFPQPRIKVFCPEPTPEPSPISEEEEDSEVS